ncbi:hypothetical protein AVEN_132356-1 [Araneus ventricosus]|uniref:RNase H type-1 domain-containing protein n=1 Tax=Araneus ventricosus TaxID=182803 RepID=A0A4Y2MT65_ARAVE|nr:hypothetical protein AVEN_132356-1 [Araneus ventricosus]
MFQIPSDFLQICFSWVIGIMPFPIKSEDEANYIRVTRLKQDIVTNEAEFKGAEFENKATGWTHYPAISIDEDIISADEDLKSVGKINIFSDDSKMEQGVGSAFCAFDSQQSIIKTWQARLQDKNSIFQAELVGIREGINYATTTAIETKIWSDSQSSLKAIANQKTTTPKARQIQESFLQSSNIRLGWIKVNVGHLGDEKADELAKGAIISTEVPLLQIPFPRSSTERELKEIALAKWQKQ